MSDGTEECFITKQLALRGSKRRYAVYVPENYNDNVPWPVILFLHGRGERGDDGAKQTEVGIGTAIRRWPERFPALVVFPQCPKDRFWDRAGEDIDAAFNMTLEEYRTDPTRYYLTGISMGGFGTWGYGARHADRFAALLPVCGGWDVEDAQRLASLPIWAFHGADDATVPAQASQRMVAAVEDAGGDVRYTEYPGVGHQSWDRTYSDPEVIAWLFAQSR